MLLNPVSCGPHASKYSLHRPRGRSQLARTYSQHQTSPSPPQPSTSKLEHARHSRQGPNTSHASHAPSHASHRSHASSHKSHASSHASHASHASHVSPSMKSVISQVGVSPPHYVQRKKRLLDDPLQATTGHLPMGVPQIYHLQDLDLETEFEAHELEPYPPLYERPKHTRRRSYCQELCELEAWPDSASTSSSPSIVLPDRRPRQPGLNPHFLKLYAIETSSRLGQTLPHINIDETLLKQLTYEDLRRINVSTPHASSQAIRLALATRKKLWTEMVTPQRQDLYGEGIPQNKRFLLTQMPTQGRQGSLLRLDSDVKPWIRQESSTMLRPCGTLKIGAGKPDVQYVVKGWCDARFVS